MGALTLKQVAARAGVTAATVRRWVKEGLVPQYEGEWTPAAASHVRIVARLRERGHTVARIREASQSGKLAFGYIDELLPSSEARYTLAEAAREIGLEPELIERLLAAMGQNALSTEEISDEDLQVLRYGAEVLAAGLPLPSAAAARARVRAGDGPGRRRGGTAFPPVPARAADARGGARGGGGAGDGGDDA